VQWALALGAAAIVATLAGRTLIARSHSHVAQRTRVLVNAFENRTDDPTIRVARAHGRRLAGAGAAAHAARGCRRYARRVCSGHAGNGASIDPLITARRTGASLLVSGNFYRTGDTILFQAQVVDVPTGRIVRAVGPIFSDAARTSWCARRPPFPRDVRTGIGGECSRPRDSRGRGRRAAIRGVSGVHRCVGRLRPR